MEMAVGSFEAIEVEGLGCSQEGFGLCDEGEREKEFVGCFLSPVAATVTRGKVGGGNLREMSLARARPRSWLTLSKRTVTSLAETPIRRLPPVTPLHEMDKGTEDGSMRAHFICLHSLTEVTPSLQDWTK